MANTSTKTFMYLLRGGISDRTTLSPEQMQKMVEKYMNYMQGLRDKGGIYRGRAARRDGQNSFRRTRPQSHRWSVHGIERSRRRIFFDSRQGSR